MGNRAIIQTRESYENEGIGVYLHWNGGYDSVSAFLKYCELKGYRTPDTDCYGWARLCQVIGNYLGGGLSLGIDTFSKDAGQYQDNGTYIIEGWEIVDRKHYDDEEELNYEMIEMLIDIDKAQPFTEQLGEDFIRAAEVDPSELSIGDIVYVQNDIGSYDELEIVGFGDGVVSGYDVTGVPYIELYGEDCVNNINNYIREEKIRIAHRR